MKRMGLASVALAVVFLTMVGSAVGAPTIYLCLAEKAGPAKSGGVEGKCPTPTKTVTYAKLALPKEEAEQQTLLSLLPHVKYVAEGVGGKPTIQFSGVNVQIVNGEGATNTVNGEGNLVIGYDEDPGGRDHVRPAPGVQTGSHDLILGEEQEFTSFGGILGGYGSTVTAPYASVTGGEGNRATGRESSVSGGYFNLASGWQSSVSAGYTNTAKAAWSSVTGGLSNTASAWTTSVTGGYDNEAGDPKEEEFTAFASVTGGEHNKGSRHSSQVSGGDENVAEGEVSSIFGGHRLKTTKEYEAIP